MCLIFLKDTSILVLTWGSFISLLVQGVDFNNSGRIFLKKNKLNNCISIIYE
jgi:hypothetical protein